MKRILVIDDDKSICNSIKETLDYEGYETHTALSAKEGLEKVDHTEYHLVFSDIKMEGMDGMELLRHIKSKEQYQFPIIMITGHASISLAVECLKSGAFDFLEKPFHHATLLDVVRKTFEVYSAEKKRPETKSPDKKTLRHKPQSDQIIGESPKMLQLKKIIEKVASSDARVLVTGHNGTGKEMVAKRVHALSHRCNMPFIEVNCAAIPGELIESEMFGHEKGSFTSAIKQKKGKFEMADGGTLFLDEIGDMSLSAQAKVLRALQEHKICRVGGEKDLSVDVRIIAATNKDLKKEIERGNFREDLYHRLCVVKIHVPPLKERQEDIPLLVNHFLEIITTRNNLPKISVDKAAMNMLQALEWEGNIRELINVIERLVVFTVDEQSRQEITITTKDIQEYVIEMNDNQ